MYKRIYSDSTFIMYICWNINCLLYVYNNFFNIKYEHTVHTAQILQSPPDPAIFYERGQPDS